MKLFPPRNLYSRIFESLYPARTPHFMRGKPESMGDYFSIEGVIEGKRPTFVMSDGALGHVWELELIAHEMMSESELSSRLAILCEIYRNTRAKSASFQIIFDSAPNPKFPMPEWFGKEKTLSQLVQSRRIKTISNFALEPGKNMRVMKRSLFLALRIEDETRLGLSFKLPSVFFDKASTTEDSRTSALLKQTRELHTIADSVEESLTRGSFKFTRLDEPEVNAICARALHGLSFQNSSFVFKSGNSLSRPLSSFAELQPHGVQVGTDSWEALSWVGKSSSGFVGQMARLLSIEEPIRVVLNLRRIDAKSSLQNKLYLLKNSNDSQSERQREEVKQTLDRLEYGEELFSTSLHILVRNENTFLHELSDAGAARRVSEFIYSFTGIPLLHEKHTAPAIFLSCLPLHYSPVMASFNARECSVLSRNLAFYLPVFCGFKGTGERLKTQIMQNRAGEAIYLSSRASETSSHVAVLAGSGAGKSFWLSNFLVGEIAAKGGLHFIIDRKTSYEILARTFGEEIGFQIAKPPESYPNIFRGRLDTDGDRLRTMVNVLTTAITLVSNDESVDAVKANLLSLAIQKTFSDLELDSSTEFNNEVHAFGKSKSTVTPVPRLTDVVDNLLPVCEREGFEKENVSWLRQRLSPFYGNGPYANLFDRNELATEEEHTPGISLFDIDGVANDKVLSTLTVLIIIAEIVRQVKRPENKGRLGTITIEEAGVIGSSSTELISFIELLWKVFRKLGYTCIGLTNDSRDYKYKAAPRTIWRMSPNKVVLRMLSQDIEEALTTSNGEPALFSDPMLHSVLPSLHKKDGVYSQAIWISDETQGTFTFSPTGYDYWLAASKPEEVETVKRLAKLLDGDIYPFFRAVSLLAEKHPFGFRNSANEIYMPNDDELAVLTKETHNEA